jgi:hypothetical protein
MSAFFFVCYQHITLEVTVTSLVCRQESGLLFSHVRCCRRYFCVLKVLHSWRSPSSRLIHPGLEITGKGQNHHEEYEYRRAMSHSRSAVNENILEHVQD